MSALTPGLYRATVDCMRNVVINVDQSYGYWLRRDGSMACADLDDITDARPLIVLDIPSERVQYVLDVLGRPAHSWTNIVAEEIEAQTKPARIEEPGLWGVVEASTQRWSRRIFVRDSDGDGGAWITPYFYPSDAPSKSRAVGWDNLIDPTLIREGVTK